MKKKKTTKETEVARNVQLLTSRPKGMSYEDYREARGKSSVSCPLKPSDSTPLKHSTMPP